MLPSRVTDIEAKLTQLRISVDSENGCLIRMSYPEVGDLLAINSSKAGLIENAYRVKSFALMRLNADNSKARINAADNSLAVEYEALTLSRLGYSLPAGKVRGRIQFKAAPDGRSIILRRQTPTLPSKEN